MDEFNRVSGVLKEMGRLEETHRCKLFLRDSRTGSGTRLYGSPSMILTTWTHKSMRNSLRRRQRPIEPRNQAPVQHDPPRHALPPGRGGRYREVGVARPGAAGLAETIPLRPPPPRVRRDQGRRPERGLKVRLEPLYQIALGGRPLADTCLHPTRVHRHSKTMVPY